jgi:glycyl-tRNA synthetase beta chain
LKQEIDFPVQKTCAGVMAFVRERYKNLLLGEEYEPDLVEAVMSAGFDKIHRLRPRVIQLKQFSAESKDFDLLAFTFKRVTNILKKEKDVFDVDPGLFQDHEETVLWEIFEDVRGSVNEMLEGGLFFQALERMAELRKPVDLFFDGVEVMVKDNEVLRKNRIGLLQQIEALVLLVADFSKFSI